MSNRLTFAIVVICVIAAAVFYLTNRSNSDSDEEFELQAKPSQTQPAARISPENRSTLTSKSTEQPTQTLSSQWQWNGESESATDVDRLDSEDLLPFTEQSVHDALQVVKVDENGDVVLDHDALISLDEALERIHNKLDPESLMELQDLIRDALPGKTGEQTASLVGDYHQFLQAKEQFDQMHAMPATYDNQPSVASIESDQRLYQELQNLRELHLGTDVAQRLFHDSDVNADFMFESIKLGLDTSLSPEEIVARRQSIEAQRRERMGEGTVELTPSDSEETSQPSTNL